MIQFKLNRQETGQASAPKLFGPCALRYALFVHTCHNQPVWHNYFSHCEFWRYTMKTPVHFWSQSLRLAMVFLVICALATTIPPSEAKVCDCEQHSAGADGTGSCTLNETSSRCDITYTGASWIQNVNSGILLAQFQSRREMLEASESLLRRRSTIGQRPALLHLNDIHHSQVSAELFEEIFVRSALWNTSSMDIVMRFLKEFDVTGDLFQFFESEGCFDIRTRDNVLRFLLIAQSSEYNGDCPDFRQ